MPRSTHPVISPPQAAADSLVSSSRSNTTFCPVGRTPKATSTGADTTFLAIRTRSAMASR